MSGYRRQARVENKFFRYKSIIGEAFEPRLQVAEALLACNILNRMNETGRSESSSIWAVTSL